MDDKIRSILAEVLKIPVARITGDLTLKEVESWDSLKHMELVVLLEETFSVQFTFEEIVAIQSLPQIKYVMQDKGVLV